MQDGVLQRLDKIESLAPSLYSNMAREAAELLATSRREPRQLQHLIERYGQTQSAALANGLALLVGGSADVAPPPVFALLEKLQRKDVAEILLNCLTGIRNLLHAPASWEPSGGAPPVLFPFLRHCLNYSLWRERLVLPSALSVVSILDTRGIIDKTFNPSQLTWLRDKLIKLRLLKRDWLEEELSELDCFLACHDIFLHSAHLDALDQLAGAGQMVNRRRAFELMKSFARGAEDLWILVERYGDSENPAVRRALADLLADEAAFPNPELLQLVFYLSEKIRDADDPEPALACLKSLRRQLHFDYLWSPRAQPSPAPYPFLIYCLNLSLKHPDNGGVATEWLRVLALLARRAALTEVFSPTQLTVLRDKLGEVRLLERFPYRADASWLRQFVNEGDLFLRPSLVARLDEIERLGADSPTSLNEESLEIMESYAWQPGELNFLVGRYGGSRNNPLVNTLALILFRRSESLRAEVLPIIFSFMERLQKNEARLAKAYCLDALRQQLLFKSPFQPSSQTTVILYRLLTDCLDGADAIAHNAALKLILLIYKEGLLEKMFAPHQLAPLRRGIAELAARRNSPSQMLAGEALTSLEEFLL